MARPERGGRRAAEGAGWFLAAVHRGAVFALAGALLTVTLLVLVKANQYFGIPFAVGRSVRFRRNGRYRAYRALRPDGLFAEGVDVGPRPEYEE